MRRPVRDAEDTVTEERGGPRKGRQGKSLRRVSGAAAVALLSLLAAHEGTALAQTKKVPTNPGLLNVRPEMDGPAVPQGAIADTMVTLSHTVKNLKPGSTARVTAVSAAPGACVFKTSPGALPPPSIVGSGGFAFSLRGMFVNTGLDVTGPCSAGVTVAGTDRFGRPFESEFASRTLRLAQPSSYVLANTSAWLPNLRFTLVSQAGTCSGYSQSIAGGSFRVGLIENDGSGFPPPDVTMAIRSGPAGTHCKWRSQPMLLPQGIRLTDVRVSVEQSGKCRAIIARTRATGRNQVVPVANVAFRSEADPVVTPGNSVVGPNPNGVGLPVNGVDELEVRLDCDATIMNDKFVTLTIDSMTFAGPQGLTFP